MEPDRHPSMYPVTGNSNDLQPEPLTMFEQIRNSRPTVFENYPHKHSFANGIVQIFVGILCIICNCTAIAFSDPKSYVSYGIWGGALFTISGLFGTIAAYRMSRYWIVSFMVFCFISSLLTIPVLTLSLSNALSATSTSCPYLECDYLELYTVNITMQSCIILFDVIELAIAIWGVVICIKTIGCDCRFRKTSTDRITLIPGYRHVGLFSVPRPASIDPNHDVWTRITIDGCTDQSQPSAIQPPPADSGSAAPHEPLTPPPAYEPHPHITGYSDNLEQVIKIE